MFLLKLGMRPWRVAIRTQVMSVASGGILLALVAALYAADRGLEPVLEQIATEHVVTAYLDPAVDQKGEAEIVDSIRTTMAAAKNKIETVSPELFLERMEGDYPTLHREVLGLGGDLTQFVPRYVSITGRIPEGAIDSFRALKGIQSVESTHHRFREVAEAFESLRGLMEALIFGLALILLVAFINLTRLNLALLSDALSTLRLLGAGGFTLRLPAVIAGTLAGVLSGVGAAVVWNWMGEPALHQIASVSPLFQEMTPPSKGIIWILPIGGAVAGLISGWMGCVGHEALQSSARD